MEGQLRHDEDHSTGDLPGQKLQPFLKWAGGKRWALSELLAQVPPKYDRYIEPFLGGASLFFALHPRTAVLADLNSELVNAYQIVRDHAPALQKWLSWLERQHSKELYYRVRARPDGSSFWRALRFIYLNRTCWNGLYRVNLRGEFNVPMGTKTAVQFEGGLLAQASALRQAEILNQDFAATLARSGPGDFVYVDPPYTVRHNNNGFIKYNEKIFTWDDQERLRASIDHARERGAMILVSNAAHQSIRDLYSGIGTFIELERSSVLAASAQFRRREKEVLIKCF